MLKKDNIPGFSAAVAHNGANYSGTVNGYGISLPAGRPSDAEISKYFFIPFVRPLSQSQYAQPDRDRYLPGTGCRYRLSNHAEIFAVDLVPTASDVVPPPNIGIGLHLDGTRDPYLYVQ